MNIIAWLVVGAIAGWIASMIMKTGMGLLADIVLGIVGAFIGGWLFSLVGVSDANTGLIGSIVVAVIGAVVLLGILRLFSRGSATTVR